VDTGGDVTSSHLVGSDLGDASVTTCLAEAARKLTFLPPPGRRLQIELRVELWPGDAPVPIIGSPTDPAPENPGQLDVRAAQAALAPLESEIGRCYAAGLERDPGLWGRIQLGIDQDERGRITRVHEEESRFPDREVASCVIRVVRSAELPTPKGGSLRWCYALRLGAMPDPAANQTPSTTESSDGPASGPNP
jgi:hypothetical protein